MGLLASSPAMCDALDTKAKPKANPFVDTVDIAMGTNVDNGRTILEGGRLMLLVGGVILLILYIARRHRP
jgi:hypothetical protein